MKRNIPCIFYFYLHNKIREKATGKTLTKKEVKSFMFEWRIPKNLRPLILKEMEILGLVKNIDRFTIELVDKKIDVEDHNAFASMLGMY